MLLRRLGRRRVSLAAPGVMCREAAEADDADYVGEDLQAVEDVAPGPDELHLGDGAERNQQAIQPAIGHDDSRAEEILEKDLAIIGPTDQRAVAEQKYGNGEHPPAAHGY